MKGLHANQGETHGVTGIPGINILHTLDILMRAVPKMKNVRKTKVTVTGIQSVEDLSYANITAVPPLPKMTLNDSTSALAAANNPVESIYLVQNDISYKLRTENELYSFHSNLYVCVPHIYKYSKISTFSTAPQSYKYIVRFLVQAVSCCIPKETVI